jgi:pimeloyl-ACP methyl ester carboxylesterase
MFDLVKTTTEDGLYLHGLLRKGDKSKYAVLHVHGFEGDFFSNRFIPVVANAVKDNGHTFLSVQTRGAGSITEFHKIDGSSITVGSHMELLKDAYKDLDAWIEFLLEKGYQKIVLEGFSLGCTKVVRYLAEGHHTKFVDKLILLSPSDLHTLMDIVTEGKYQDYLRAAKQKIQKGEGEEIVPKSYGDINLSYQTYASWGTFDHFGKMFNFGDSDNNFMLLNKIDVPVKLIVGEKDDYFHPANPNHPEEAIDIMKLNINDFNHSLIKDADHQFSGKEHELAQEVILFLEQ